MKEGKRQPLEIAKWTVEYNDTQLLIEFSNLIAKFDSTLTCRTGKLLCGLPIRTYFCCLHHLVIIYHLLTDHRIEVEVRTFDRKRSYVEDLSAQRVGSRQRVLIMFTMS